MVTSQNERSKSKLPRPDLGLVPTNFLGGAPGLHVDVIGGRSGLEVKEKVSRDKGRDGLFRSTDPESVVETVGDLKSVLFYIETNFHTNRKIL